MKSIPSVLRQILYLALASLAFISLGWLGIMPVAAVQVLLNTLFIGAVLVLFADILINAPVKQEH